MRLIPTDAVSRESHYFCFVMRQSQGRHSLTLQLESRGMTPKVVGCLGYQSFNRRAKLFCKIESKEYEKGQGVAIKGQH